jgi:hypothetical protein
MQTMNTVALAKFMACCKYQKTICPPWSTFRLMDSLVPNGRKIVNNVTNVQPTFKKSCYFLWVYIIKIWPITSFWTLGLMDLVPSLTFWAGLNIIKTLRLWNIIHNVFIADFSSIQISLVPWFFNLCVKWTQPWNDFSYNHRFFILMITSFQTLV